MLKRRKCNNLTYYSRRVKYIVKENKQLFSDLSGNEYHKLNQFSTKTGIFIDSWVSYNRLCWFN